MVAESPANVSAEEGFQGVFLGCTSGGRVHQMLRRDHPLPFRTSERCQNCLWYPLHTATSLRYQGGMRVCGQEISAGVIGRIAAILEREPHISRQELSRRVCEWANRKGLNGKPREVSCRKLLLDLHKRSVIRRPLPNRGSRLECSDSVGHTKSLACSGPNTA